MKDKAFDYSEFIEDGNKEEAIETEEVEEKKEGQDDSMPDNELEIQRAVVEELAADKAELHEKYNFVNAALSKALENLKAKNSEIFTLKAELERQKATKVALENTLAQQRIKNLDEQERNPNALALLDRDVNLPDRFPGETRDHVLEALRKCRDEAEAEGRIRKAQILEGVLVENEPSGMLEKRREELNRLFEKNGNIVSGPVIEELKRLGIPYKDGEKYLMPSEIMARTY